MDTTVHALQDLPLSALPDVTLCGLYDKRIIALVSLASQHVQARLYVAQQGTPYDAL